MSDDVSPDDLSHAPDSRTPEPGAPRHSADSRPRRRQPTRATVLVVGTLLSAGTIAAFAEGFGSRGTSSGGGVSSSGETPGPTTTDAPSAPDGDSEEHTTEAFFDDFDGPEGSAPDPDVWNFETGDGGWGNDELQTYTKSNAVLDGDSNLVITARIDRDAPRDERYTSSRITTKGTVEMTYGTVEARIKLPDGQGLLPAFWMLGSNIDEVGYPASGEIDIVETPFSTGYSSHLVHGPGVDDDTANIESGDDVDHDVPLSEDFHVFGAVRSPGSVVLTIDGATVAEITEDSVPDEMRWVFDDPYYLLLNVAIGGNWPGNPTEDTPEVAEMIVDWVRVTPAD